MKTLRILVAEDSDRDFDLIAHALAQSGRSTELVRVRDGVEATHYFLGTETFKDRFVQRFPDIVLVDLKMPRMNGFELLEWIESHPEHRVIPTIVMSSSAVPADVARAYASGAHTYFVKPIEHQEFVTLFRRVAEYWSLAQTPGSIATRT